MCTSRHVCSHGACLFKYRQPSMGIGAHLDALPPVAMLLYLHVCTSAASLQQSGDIATHLMCELHVQEQSTAIHLHMH